MRWWHLLPAALLTLGCQPRTEADPFPGPVKSAEFGLFYGGQIQERERIPLVLDQAKQTHGIRIDFDGPTPQELLITWELDMPGSTRGVRDERGRRGRGRLVKHDRARVPAGRTRFEQTMGFSPGDPVGMWNIRVRVGDQVVIDRAFEVHRPTD